MEELNQDTESKILDSAKEVFIQNGLDGARMQQIADKAGINKSLLHYYYRTKEKLFESVLKFAFKQFLPNPMEFLSSDLPLFDKIRIFVDRYTSMIEKNRFIPIFVLHEVNKNPARIAQLMKEIGIRPELLIEQIEKEAEAGLIRSIEPKDLVINMLSMCLFPYIASPLIQKIMFNDNNASLNQFLEKRKNTIADFIIESIKVK